MHDYSVIEQIIQVAKNGDLPSQQKIFSLLHVRFLPIVTCKLRMSQIVADPGEIEALASGFCSSAVQKINELCPMTHARWSMVRLMSIFNNLLDDFILNLLTEKTKKGNKEAENRLFELLRVKLVERITMKSIKVNVMNAITDEDLVHEALAVIHSKYKETEFEKGILPWAYGVLDTIIKSHWSRKKVHEELMNENIDRVRNNQIDEEPADMLYEKQEMIDILKNALEHLNYGEKEIFRLKLQGYSGEEIQGRLGLKRSAMDVRVHRAVQKMKKILCDQGTTYNEM